MWLGQGERPQMFCERAVDDELEFSAMFITTMKFDDSWQFLTELLGSFIFDISLSP